MSKENLRIAQERIDKLIEEKNITEIKKILLDLNEVDIAELLDEVDPMTTSILFRTLPKDIAVDVFSRFDLDQQEEIIRSSTDREVDDLMKDLFFDDKIDIIEEMPANVVNKILKASSPEERRLINQFLLYPEDSAGSIMTIEYATVAKDMTAKEALAHLKHTGVNKQTIFTSYVMNENRVLEGTVSLRSLVLSEENTLIENIMETDILYVHADDDQESVAQLFQKYDFVAIPVVDKENRLIGIITVDDIMDVIEQEATEDFQIMAATTPTEDKYMDTRVFELAKHRILWLLILMVSATLSGSILEHYEDTLQKVTTLMIFVPMLTDTGGNAGSQSSTLIIRGLSTRHLEFSDFFRVMWKEFRVSIVVGLVLALVNFLRIVLIHGSSFGIALTVSITLVATVMIAKLLGGMLPMLANKIGLDPAIMASPLITTIADASTLMIYFAVARVVLKL